MTSCACEPTAAFANGKEQSNAMPSQNLPSGHHCCPTHRTSTCLKGCFSRHSSKQQSFHKPTKPFPMVRNQSYMGNLYIWFGLWMLMGTTVRPQRREFWATSPINTFHGPLFVWAFGLLELDSRPSSQPLPSPTLLHQPSSTNFGKYGK